MSQSTDHHHIENTLKVIAANREELEAAWEPRRLKLDVFLKLRMFERSASEVTTVVDAWADSIQDGDIEVDSNHAKQQSTSLDAKVMHLHNLSQQALNRGQELLQYLDNFTATNMIDLPDIKHRVSVLLDFLAERQSDIPAVAEIYRIRLQNIMQLNHCNMKAQEIITSIHARQKALKLLSPALKTLQESEVLMTSVEEIRLDVEKMRPAVMQFQEYAEGIVQNDIDGAEVAHRLLKQVTAQWQRLLHCVDELCRAISAAVTFYRAAEKVRGLNRNFK